MARRGLTPKQERFVAEYLIDLNATQAAIRAGYSAPTAQEQSSRLLSNVMIREMVEKRNTKALHKAELTGARTLEEIRRLSQSDFRALQREDGSFLPMAEWPDDIAAAVSSLEFDDKGQIAKVKLWSKPDALRMAAQHLKLIGDSNTQVNVNITLEALVAASMKVEAK